MESGAGLEEKKTGYPAAFLKWVKSDSVVKTKEGYKEQMGQYKKVFKTLADLYKHYQKEYSMDEDVAVGPGIDGGTSLPEVANTVSEGSSAEEMEHDHWYEMARGYKDDGMSMGEVEEKLEDMGCSNATDIALDLFPDDEEGDYEDDLEEADLYKENLARFKSK